MQRIRVSSYRDTWSEIKKVSWPDQQTTSEFDAARDRHGGGAGILLGGIDFVLLNSSTRCRNAVADWNRMTETASVRRSPDEHRSRNVSPNAAPREAGDRIRQPLEGRVGTFCIPIPGTRTRSRSRSRAGSSRSISVIASTRSSFRPRKRSKFSSGQRHTVQRKVFPGYVLVRMEMDDETWYALRNTPGVTGFVNINNKPVPLAEREVQAIMKGMTAEAPKVKISFQLGDTVRIIDGPFADFRGEIDEINQEKGKIQGARLLLWTRNTGRARFLASGARDVIRRSGAACESTPRGSRRHFVG